MLRKWVTLCQPPKMRSSSYLDETTDPRIVGNKETIGPSLNGPRGTMNKMSKLVVFRVPSVRLLRLGDIEPMLGAYITISFVLEV